MSQQTTNVVLHFTAKSMWRDTRRQKEGLLLNRFTSATPEVKKESNHFYAIGDYANINTEESVPSYDANASPSIRPPKQNAMNERYTKTF